MLNNNINFNNFASGSGKKWTRYGTLKPSPPPIRMDRYWTPLLTDCVYKLYTVYSTSTTYSMTSMFRSETMEAAEDLAVAEDYPVAMEVTNDEEDQPSVDGTGMHFLIRYLNTIHR